MNRTIEAPGVEMFEIDRSEYSRQVTGTRVLVPGFANQGMDYEPITITSRQAFLNYYGTPTNEAERYFYAACTEVMDRGGVLHACKLPYDNASMNKYVVKKYRLITDNLQEIPDFDSVVSFDTSVLVNIPFNKALQNALIENIQLNSDEKIKVNNIEVKGSIVEELGSLLLSTYTLNELSPEFGEYVKEKMHIEDEDEPIDMQDLVSQLQKFVWDNASLNNRLIYTETNPETLSADELLAVIKNRDSNIRKYLTIENVDDGQPTDSLTFDAVDLLETGEAQPDANEFWIIDKLRRTYSNSSTRDEKTGELENCIGIMPVVTTAANALYYQGLIEQGKNIAKGFYVVDNAKTLNGKYTITSENTVYPFTEDDTLLDSISRQVAINFPIITFASENHFDNEYLKSIGIVVLRAFVDPANGNKINFEVVESFVGELDPRARNPRTNATTYIGTIINQNSDYISFYSNCLPDNTAKEYYDKAAFLWIENQTAGMLGFYNDMVSKDISLENSIEKGLEIVFSKQQDIHKTTVDLVVDAGVSTIAQFIKSAYGSKKGQYDPAGTKASVFRLNNYSNDIWMSIIRKYDFFCREIRRDCMFIGDAIRTFCVRGSKKLCRPTSPTTTIDNAILPNLKFLTGFNTSFGAGYCDWFKCVDDTSGEMFWCPPSIKAAGVYLYTDNTSAPWQAPAGINRGRISNAIDLAFSPSIRQAGDIYTKGWNYAIQYADAGIVLEGQKTLQQKETAFDRINVRRLFLTIERYVYNRARHYVYEPNTATVRSNLKSELDAYLNGLVANGAIYDFLTICDETINTPEVIENHELRVKVGIKPTPTTEFIIIQFYASRIGGSWDEIMYND